MEFELEKLNSINIPAAISLTDELVGKGLYDELKMKHIIEDNGKYFYLVKIDEKYMGYFYCMYHENYSIEELTEMDLDQIAEMVGELGNVGICKSIGLKEEVRGKGISEKLQMHFQQLLWDEGCRHILIPSWKKGDIVPAQRHLEVCGYRAVKTLITPWIDDETLECPFCKQPRCICDAVVFMKSKGEI